MGVPEFLYAASDQEDDFGTLVGAMTVRLCQLGRKVPLGIPLTEEINLPY